MSFVLRILECVCIGLGLIVAVGCGGAADCGPVGVSVSPNTATADHTAAPPGNQQQFFATNNFPIKQGCVAITAAILNNVTWSTSDPGDVSISNTQGSTYGVATCINAVSSPVTIGHATPTRRRNVYRHRITDMQMKTRRAVSDLRVKRLKAKCCKIFRDERE